MSQIEEKNFESMEALLTQAAKGIHVLFDNKTIADVLKKSAQNDSLEGEKDFYSFDKIKKVQNVMTDLIAQKTYIDKISFLESLDAETYQLVVRAYLHIIENSLKKTQPLKH